MMIGLARHASLGRPKPKLVEIGTQVGHSTRALLAVAAMMDAHVYSFEIDAKCGEGKLKAWVEARGLTDRWTFTAGRSQDATPVEDADFLLVDGDHSYDAVCADMILHATKVRPGGVIVLDDYHVMFPGKNRWVQERWRELQPLTIGPWAILIKQPGDDDIYRKVY